MRANCISRIDVNEKNCIYFFIEFKMFFYCKLYLIFACQPEVDIDTKKNNLSIDK